MYHNNWKSYQVYPSLFAVYKLDKCVLAKENVLQLPWLQEPNDKFSNHVFPEQNPRKEGLTSSTWINEISGPLVNEVQ